MVRVSSSTAAFRASLDLQEQQQQAGVQAGRQAGRVEFV
jgi:hypothetical protein